MSSSSSEGDISSCSSDDDFEAAYDNIIDEMGQQPYQLEPEYTEEELQQKILHFHDNDSERIKIAASGRNFYHQHFSAEKIIEFILDVTFERPHSFDYIWAKEIYS